MRFSQPYGTPQPPLNTYPRYINGNPVTGTEGSIPPATAFDEAQIEIINVIANAKAARTTTIDPTLSDPDHTKLYQLWDSIISLIARKFITTPIIKTVHGAGADFPDLNAALDWLSVYTITWSGSVTFMIAPGKWTYTRTVEVNHPNASRIVFQGGALLGAAPVPGNMSCTGYSLAARANDGNSHIIYLRSIFATELSWTGGVTGFLVTGTGAPMFRYLLMTGSQSIQTPSDATSGAGMMLYDDAWYECIALWGWGQHGIYLSSCTLRGKGSLSLTISFSGGHGLQILSGAIICDHNSHCIFYSNGWSGLRIAGGHAYFAKISCYGNGSGPLGSPGQPGVDCFEGGTVWCENWVDFEYNMGPGIAICDGALYSLYSTSYFSNNGGHGMYCFSGGTVVATNASFSGNGSGYSIVLVLGSNANIVGSYVGQTTSPPVNVDGNQNSYIAL